MAFVPYSRQCISEEDIVAVTEVLRSEYLTQGPAIQAFEAAFAGRHQTSHAIAVSSATAGLHISCLALGVGLGSRVWTSPNSFLASANCALYCGAVVDFVDIDPATRNISIAELTVKLEQSAKAGLLPDVVIPVDFAGLPSDLREIRALADKYGFKILEDASHATGATYLGAPIGSQYADATVFSFHPVKIITTAEGGIVTTHDKNIAKQLRLLRSHGISRELADFTNTPHGPWYYEQINLGFNYRITDVQAALGLSQLKRLNQMHETRVRLANRYDNLLADLPLQLPKRFPDRSSAWHLYVIELADVSPQVTRNSVFQRLRDAQVGVNVHYIPIHTQPYYRQLGFYYGQFPAAEAYYGKAISLPLYPTLSETQQDYVAGVLRSALTH